MEQNSEPSSFEFESLLDNLDISAALDFTQQPPIKQRRADVICNPDPIYAVALGREIKKSDQKFDKEMIKLGLKYQQSDVDSQKIAFESLNSSPKCSIFDLHDSLSPIYQTGWQLPPLSEIMKGSLDNSSRLSTIKAFLRFNSLGIAKNDLFGDPRNAFLVFLTYDNDFNKSLALMGDAIIDNAILALFFRQGLFNPAKASLLKSFFASNAFMQYFLQNKMKQFQKLEHYVGVSPKAAGTLFEALIGYYVSLQTVEFSTYYIVGYKMCKTKGLTMANSLINDFLTYMMRCINTMETNGDMVSPWEVFNKVSLQIPNDYKITEE